MQQPEAPASRRPSRWSDRTRRRLTGPLGLVGAALLSVVSACSVGPSTRPPVALDGGAADSTGPTSTAADLPPLDQAPADRLAWSDCADSTRERLGDAGASTTLTFECVRMQSVLDPPSRPGRGTMRVSLLKAGDGAVPLVVVNDAAGEPGTLAAARLATQLPAEFFTTFSLIGMDRRGTGDSEAARCVSPEVREQIVGYDPTSTEVAPLLETARRASQECVLDLDDRLAALDTWRAAADLETLRESLGVSRLNAIGRGEGSRVLTTYGSRYPNRVGRVVLDGALDPTADATGLAENRAIGAEQAFDAFAADCVARRCPLGTDPRQAVRDLLDQLRGQRTNSGADSGAGNEVPVNAGTALRAILRGLEDRSAWPRLAEAIAAARGGSATALTAWAAPLLVDSNQDDPPLLDGELVTGCNDTTSRLPPEQVSKLAQDWQAKHPLFGALFAQQLVLCGPWPVPAQPLPDMDLAEAPPILLLSTAADPVIPAAATERAAQHLSRAVLVSWQGGGHGAFPRVSCTTTLVQRFLVDGQVPEDGTVCPP